MAGFQFIHIEAYSREVSKQKTKGNLNIRDIIAETGREIGNCPHVANPQEPNVLLGELKQVEIEVTAWADSMTDAKGRKLRKDAHCLLAGVISLPKNSAEDWNNFKEKSIEYLEEKYGDRLKCVVEHLDESHPHIHFYVVPRKKERFENIHDGKKAALNAKSQNKLKGEQNLAYISAMRNFQDHFSKCVGQFFGLARLGPGKRRLTRSQWHAEQKQAEMLLNTKKTAKGIYDYYKNKGLAEGLKESQRWGSVLGNAFNVFKNQWHKPSAQLTAELTALKIKNKQLEEEKEKAIRHAKHEADSRVTKAAEREQAAKSISDGLAKDLERKEEQLTQTLRYLTPAQRKAFFKI